MFEARLTEGIILKKIVESIKDLVTDVNFETNPTGISLQAMDSSHVALVNLMLNMEGFESYRSDRPLTLGVNMGHLAKVMKLAGNDDIIELSAEEEVNKLTIRFINKKQGKSTEFDLNLFTLDSEVLGIPDTEYAAEIAMSSSEFTKICRELYQIAETVTVQTDKATVKFMVEGEVGKGSVSIESQEGDKEEDNTTISVTDDVKLSFALRYLNMFNKASSLSTVVNLAMSPDTPLVVEYKIDKLGGLKFYLAPKISDE